MPAGRNCRACGEPLGGDVRWCLRCYAPAWEYSPRAPLHRGDFVDAPHATGGHVPHWSRWERGATSFGPVGRLVATGIVLWLLVATIMTAFFISILGMLLASVVLLRDIWKRDWIVPEEPHLPPLPDRPREVEVHEVPPTTAHQVWRWTGYAAVVVLGAAFAYGPVQAKAIALIAATLIGLTWFLRGFLSR